MQDFNLDTKIWRYLSFDKFMDLITTGELYFASPSQFDDTWEMYPPRWLVNKENWIKKFREVGVDGSIDLEKLADNAVGFFEAAYLRRDNLYAFSCWSMSEEDHAGLWDLYTDKRNAVAISTTPRKLLDALHESEEDRARSISIGRVAYVDFDNAALPTADSPVFSIDIINGGIEENQASILPFLYKKSSYEYEKEVRISVHYPFCLPKKNRIKFCIKSIVEDVVVAPRAYESFFAHVTEVAQKYLSVAKIKYSSLRSPPSVMTKGDEFIEKMNNSRRVNQTQNECGPKYIEFSSLAEFEKWHEKAKEYLGIPKCGVDGATGAFAYDSAVTSAWYKPIIHPDGEKHEVLAGATPELSFGYNLLSREECEERGWFR